MPDTPFVSQETLHQALDKQHSQPRKAFKGQVLAPYNRTYKDLAIAASRETDSNSFFVWLLVYLLIRGEAIYGEGLSKYNGNIEAAEDHIDLELPLSVELDIERFRFNVRKWARHFTDADAETASTLLIELRKEAELTAIKSVESDESEGKARQRV